MVLIMNREDMMNEIDIKLDKLCKVMDYSDYVYFIKHNYPLNIYDRILGRIDIGHYPKFFNVFITNNMMNKINILLDQKIEDLII